MIRLFHVYFPVRTVFLGVSEAVLATLAFVAAMVVCFGGINASIILNYEQGFVKIAIIVVVLLLCMYYFDLYDSMILSNRREIFTRLVQVLGTLCILLAAVYWVFPHMNVGRPVFAIGTVALTAGLLGCRRLFLLVNSRPELADRTLILGNGALARTLIQQLESRPEFGWRVVAHVTEDNIDDFQNSEGFGREVYRVTQAHLVSRIIVTMSERRGRLPVDALLAMKTSGVAVQDGSDVYEVITGRVPLETLRPGWLVFSPGFQLSRPLVIYKRITSILLSTVCLLVTAPVMLLIALAIRIDSPGPIIFRQKRVGEHGRIFTLYKFRSMYDGVDSDGIFRPAGKRDDRCTRVGRWIRATRVDELPQLFNIFKGDMYFVGPRPFVPNQEEECVRHIPFYKQRWTVKPGATGWAQVNREYCSTLADNAEKLTYDLFYIKNVSVGLDLLILFKTIKILLLGRGAR